MWISPFSSPVFKCVAKANGQCISTGDPHITTFDHMKFDLYDLGKYTLAKSVDNTINVPDFEIQIETSPYGKVSQTESAELRITSRDGSRDLLFAINRDGSATITTDGETSDLVRGRKKLFL